jgi:hypothetical protein
VLAFMSMIDTPRVPTPTIWDPSRGAPLGPMPTTLPQKVRFLTCPSPARR